MKYFLNLLTLACSILLIAGCSEETIHQVRIKGNLTGYVYSGIGNLPISNVQVTIAGTSPLVKINTDSNGKFTVPDLATGTYQIICSKEGYGTNKLLGYAFIGGNIANVISVKLYALPDFKIVKTEATVAKESVVANFLYCTLHVDDPNSNSRGYFRYYLSQTPDISISKYLQTDILGLYSKGMELSYVKWIDTKTFPPGSDLYVVIYSCTDDYSNYLDLETGNKIYTSLGETHSGIIHLKMPL